jgi:ribosomal protein S18 acetylase RimI-like enzyme
VVSRQFAAIQNVANILRRFTGSPHQNVTITIRPLAGDDAARYHALRQRGLAEHPEAFTSSAEEEAASADKVAKRLVRDPRAPHDIVLGAFDGDTLVGVIGMSVDPRAKARHRGHVFGMYVAGECGRRGVGAKLVEALIAHARSCHGLDALVLTVTLGNDGARRLYERAGFTAFGCEPGAIRVAGRPYDKLHMIRWLAAPDRAS